MSHVADVGPVKERGFGSSRSGQAQGWGLAALILGVCLILASGITHVVCWLYVSLAYGNMGPTDTRLGLVICLVDVLVLLGLGVLANVAGVLGLREARLFDAHRGIALTGMLAASAGLLCWLLAATNLLIVAISRLQ
jgi:hypothetical protein